MLFFESPMGKLLREYEAEKEQFPMPRGRHGLPKPLIVTLTSYPKRFRWLHLTLKSVLEQTITPDKVVLWVAEGDREHLHRSTRDLGDRIEIATCQDLGSYKKIVPSIERYKDCFIVSCDDDVYYPRNWLYELVNAVADDNCYYCHSAHRFHLVGPQQLAQYRDWTFDVQEGIALEVRYPTLRENTQGTRPRVSG